MPLRIPSLLAVLFAVSPLVAGDPPLAVHPDTRWVRRTVMLRTDDVRPGRVVAGHLFRGEKVLDANRVYTVRRVQDGWVELTGGRGWVSRAEVIRTDEAAAFFTAKIRAEPDVAKWHGRRGVVGLLTFQLANRLEDAAPRLTAGTIPAPDDFQTAVRLDPECVRWRVHLGRIHMHRQEWDRATEQVGEAIRLAPADEVGYYYRAQLARLRGEFAAATADAVRAIELAPADPGNYELRGALALFRGKPEEALAAFDKAIALDPEYAGAYASRGYLRLRARQYEAAWADLTRAMELERTELQVRVNRAWCSYFLADYRLAAADFERWAERAPTNPEPARVRAWILATCPDETVRDPHRAVELAGHAIRLVGKNATHRERETLAAALAAAGDFDAAVREQKRAVEQLESAKPVDEDDLLSAKLRLTLYQNKQPYRE